MEFLTESSSILTIYAAFLGIELSLVEIVDRRFFDKIFRLIINWNTKYIIPIDKVNLNENGQKKQDTLLRRCNRPYNVLRGFFRVNHILCKFISVAIVIFSVICLYALLRKNNFNVPIFNFLLVEKICTISPQIKVVCFSYASLFFIRISMIGILLIWALVMSAVAICDHKILISYSGRVSGAAVTDPSYSRTENSVAEAIESYDIKFKTIIRNDEKEDKKTPK